ncbi:MAG: DNA-binding protein [Actinobacteria bacterium]|nr:DNA-binding protein [Actinomycetota bacterium]
MKYSQGKVGRVFVARVEDGDNLIEEIKKLAVTEKVEAGIFYVIGALKDAAIVVGPEECVLPPVPVWREFSDGREIVGIGTLFNNGGEPVLHLHGAFGRGDQVVMGCIRKLSEVYLVAEVIITELTGTGAVKEFEQESGLKMLKFLPV